VSCRLAVKFCATFGKGLSDRMMRFDRSLDTRNKLRTRDEREGLGRCVLGLGGVVRKG